MKKNIYGFLIAAVLWFVMFSPWTAHLVNFWWTMAASGLILTTYALHFGQEWKKRLIPASASEWVKQIVLGIIIAVVLWGVFWIGDKLSQLMFDFARPQVDTIYGMKGDMPGWVIAVLLLFVIGPAEEIFWRGFLQENLRRNCPFRNLSGQAVPWVAFLLVLALYSFVHIWSFNFMLLCAAGVCGFCWGIMYRFFPQWLPALVISHALWDAAAFVIFPF